MEGNLVTQLGVGAAVAILVIREVLTVLKWRGGNGNLKGVGELIEKQIAALGKDVERRDAAILKALDLLDNHMEKLMEKLQQIDREQTRHCEITKECPRILGEISRALAEATSHQARTSELLSQLYFVTRGPVKKGT